MTRILIAFVASLFIASIASAASLEIKGAPARAGAQGKAHKDEIEVLSYSWGAAQAGARKGPGTITIVIGPAANDGDVDGRDFLLWQRGGSQISSMTLMTVENGAAVKYKLDRCFVKSWSTSGDADDRPVGGTGVISYEAISVAR